jgi:hypothetical protein
MTKTHAIFKIVICFCLIFLNLLRSLSVFFLLVNGNFVTIQYKNARSCFAISVSVVRHVPDRTKKTFIKCIKTLKVKLEIKEFLTARMIMVASVANNLHAMTFRFGGGLFNFW